MVDSEDEKSNAPPDLLDNLRAVVREELRAERRREAVPDPLLTKEDAAEVLNVSERLVDTLIASGEIASIKVRRTRRIPPEALRTYLRQQAEEGQA